jgi:transcriptional regulator with XRE-family HTH domain
MIDPPEKIGERLHNLRTALDMNQARVAESLGITQSAWSQYESGTRKITIEVAGVLAVRFGVTFDWIYRGDPSGLPMGLATLLGV